VDRTRVTQVGRALRHLEINDPRLLAAGAGTLGAQLPHFLQIEPQAWRTSLASSEVVVGAARGQHFDPALRSTLRGSV